MNANPSEKAFNGEVIGVIPARLSSTRFPNKPLALIGGVPLVCWTWLNATRVKSLREVFVAAEDPEIVSAVTKFGGQAKLVQGRFSSGSDRIAAAVESLESAAVVNIQGDEPFVDPAAIDAALHLLQAREDFGITTLAKVIRGVEEYRNPNNVKLVMDRQNRCLYFSRSPIPACHQAPEDGFPDNLKVWRHLGIYCYRREALSAYRKWAPSPLEISESLEQLRYLEHGGNIGAVEAVKAGPDINAPEDIESAENYIRTNHITFDHSL
ncbi:3-deoxy-manno-octulosonate cytidylyltransferase [bacterium]|nr:3-deoxy-manno-octulosonate cytidylyltransferase [bacterium]MBU1651596.1 3-deoxy-manno-octulosonate cytidylyltransferase [bacterium]